MFDELEELYSKDSLESYEYDDIYERFTHLDRLEEVKPYLYAISLLFCTKVLIKIDDRIYTVNVNDNNSARDID